MVHTGIDKQNDLCYNSVVICEDFAKTGVRSMNKVIIVTSLKGGVGKTTLTANLAMSLAESGKSVIAIDCDLESRCLDMILGLENDSLYNLADILSGRCELDDAITRDERCDNLSFIAAPSIGFDRNSDEYSECFTPEKISALIAALRDSYEYILFDLPAHPDKWYELLLGHANYALVVAMHTAVSIRSAEKTAMTIVETYEKLMEQSGEELLPDDEGGLKIRLVINGFKHRDVTDGTRSGIYDIISKTSVKLLGVVPNDERMAAAQESGVLAYQLKGDSASCSAFKNIAARIDGVSIPLLSGILGKKARRKSF